MESYVKDNPEDYSNVIRLGYYYHKVNKTDKLAELNLDIPIDKISIKDFERLILCLLWNNEQEKALSSLYEFWRINKSKEACESIVRISSYININDEDIIVCDSDTVVELKNQFGESEKYIIYDKDNADYSTLYEVNSKQVLFNELMGKKVGDSVKFGENRFTKEPEMKEIVKLITKHQFAFNGALNKLSNQYRGKTDFAVYKAKSPEEGVQQIFNLIETIGNQENNNDRLKNQKLGIHGYQERQLPIGVLEKLFHQSPILLWYSFTGDKTIGIANSLQTDEEWNYSFSILMNSNKEWCCDITAVLALYYSEVTDIIVDKLGSFKICQTTVDLIETLKENKDNSALYPSPILIQDKNEIIHRTLPEQYDLMLSDITKISDWIGRYSAILALRYIYSKAGILTCLFLLINL